MGIRVSQVMVLSVAVVETMNIDLVSHVTKQVLKNPLVLYIPLKERANMVHALQDAKPANLEALMMGVCLLTLMGSVNIFAQHLDIVGMEKVIKLVMIAVFVEFQLNLRIQEKIAGIVANINKDHVIGVDLRAFVAPKRMIGQTIQTDVMVLLVEKQCTNVLYDQLHVQKDAKTAKLVVPAVVCLSILMGPVNFFAQNQDIVVMGKLTKLVMTVGAVIFQMYALNNAEPACRVALVEACPLIIMTRVNIFAQTKDIAEMVKLTKQVLPVLVLLVAFLEHAIIIYIMPIKLENIRLHRISGTRI